MNVWGPEKLAGSTRELRIMWEKTQCLLNVNVANFWCGCWRKFHQNNIVLYSALLKFTRFHKWINTSQPFSVSLHSSSYSSAIAFTFTSKAEAGMLRAFSCLLGVLARQNQNCILCEGPQYHRQVTKPNTEVYLAAASISWSHEE